MHTSLTLLALSALAAAERGLLHPAQLAAKRDIMARQTSMGTELPTELPTGIPSDSLTCLTALQSLYSTVPTPPPELVKYEESNPPTDPCTYSVPNSLTSQFTSYEMAVRSWYDQHSSEFISALSACPQFSSLTDAGPSVCTTPAVGGGGSGGSGGQGGGGAKTTANGGSGSGGGGRAGDTATGAGATGATGTSKNAGARETGFVAAAVAAAGFLGAVAAL
jgi:uncharacterized membrane protein YgcG